MNDFDFYVSCNPCLIKLIETYDFQDEMQKEIFSFLNERAGNQILKGEFLFHEWDLCGKCFSKLCKEFDKILTASIVQTFESEDWLLL